MFNYRRRPPSPNRLPTETTKRNEWLSRNQFPNTDNIYIKQLKFYDKTGKEISINEWKNLLNNKNYRHIKRDRINNYIISTIWLGLETKIYESVIFTPNDEDKYTGWQE